MRVVFVEMGYRPLAATGGASTWVSAAAQGLARRGHEVEVIARAFDAPSTEMDGPVRLHRILPPLLRVLGLGRRLGAGLRSHAREAARAVERIDRERPIDLVCVPDVRAEGLDLVADPRWPVVLSLFTDSELAHRLEGGWILPFRPRYRLERRQAAGARFVVTASKALALEARERLGIRRPIDVLESGVDADLFRPEERTASDAAAFDPARSAGGGEGRAADDPAQRILFVGRLGRWKGLDTLAAAAPAILARRPAARFRIIGGADGGGARWLRAFRRAGAGDAVEVVPWVERGALVGEYQRAAVCVVPSRWDNAPNVLLEAMAAGRPVVASRAGGIPEYLPEGVGAGILAPPGDAAALAEAIVRILLDPALGASLGERARACILERFTLGAFSARLEAYFARCREEWKVGAR